ncbi:MAG: DMT family transporter [Paracoccaceae bacterium]
MNTFANDPIRAGLWMMGAVVSFTLMAVAGREVLHELDTFEVMMYRSLMGICIVLFFSKLAGTVNEINVQQLPLHLTRNITHFIGQNLWFFAVTAITLPQLFAFEFSVPIWVALFAPIFLSEKLTKRRLFAALIGFFGILIVARPDNIGVTPGIIAAALCAICFTGTGIATKLLTRNQSITCILFWLTVMQAILGIICAGYDFDISFPSQSSLPWVILIGLAGLLAHFCITKALQLADAIVVYPMDFVRLPLATAVGVLFYNEPIQLLVFVGAAIILGANFLNIISEKQKS